MPVRPNPLDQGLKQLDRYLDRLGLETGTLVIFDRRHDAGPITERTEFTSVNSPAGRHTILLRC